MCVCLSVSVCTDGSEAKDASVDCRRSWTSCLIRDDNEKQGGDAAMESWCIFRYLIPDLKVSVYSRLSLRLGIDSCVALEPPRGSCAPCISTIWSFFGSQESGLLGWIVRGEKRYNKIEVQDGMARSHRCGLEQHPRRASGMP